MMAHMTSISWRRADEPAPRGVCHAHCVVAHKGRRTLSVIN